MYSFSDILYYDGKPLYNMVLYYMNGGYIFLDHDNVNEDIEYI